MWANSGILYYRGGTCSWCSGAIKCTVRLGMSYKAMKSKTLHFGGKLNKISSGLSDVVLSCLHRVLSSHDNCWAPDWSLLSISGKPLLHIHSKGQKDWNLQVKVKLLMITIYKLRRRDWMNHFPIKEHRNTMYRS